jgi:hypothetical protein
MVLESTSFPCIIFVKLLNLSRIEAVLHFLIFWFGRVDDHAFRVQEEACARYLGLGAQRRLANRLTLDKTARQVLCKITAWPNFSPISTSPS